MTKSGFAVPFQIAACAVGTCLLGSVALFAQANQGAKPDLQAQVHNVDVPRPVFLNTSDLAAPNAEEVIIDVPNAFHWARYQRGDLNGWRYFLYPDGSAKAIQDKVPQRSQFTLTCQSGVACQVVRPDGTSFSIPAVGGARPNPPTAPEGEAIARYLAEWILAGTGKPTVRPAPVDVVHPGVSGHLAPAPPPEAPPHKTAQLKPLNAGGLPDETSQPEVGAITELSEPSDRPDQVCSEPEPFLPSSCAQPLRDLERQEPAIRGNTPSAPSNNRIKAASAPVPTSRPKLTTGEMPEDTPKTFFDRIDLACSVTASTSLGFIKSGSSTRSIGKPRASIGCSTKLTEKLSLRFSILKYANARDQSDDDPDFTYAFSYRYSEKLSFSYSNYSAQFGGANGGLINALTSGSLRGSYQLPRITLPNNKRVACSTGFGLPNPIDENFNLSCGYAVTDKLRISGSANLYFPNAQGDYDPDYTYTASYRPSKDWLISYSNYSNNRFPWNRGKNPGPGLSGGSLSVTYGLKF